MSRTSFSLLLILLDIFQVSVQDQVCKLAAELAVFMDKLSDPATAASNVFDRLIDYMPLAPASEDGSLTEVPSIEFTKVRKEI